MTISTGFYGDGHRALAEGQTPLHPLPAGQRIDHGDTDAACKAPGEKLSAAGFLRHCVPEAYGGISPEIDSRSYTILRETLGHEDGLADFAFAMQGLALRLSASRAVRTETPDPAEGCEGRTDFGFRADRSRMPPARTWQP